MKGRGFGILVNLLIGVAGALIGGWLFKLLKISTGSGFWGSLITSLVGAIVLLFIISLFRRKSK